MITPTDVKKGDYITCNDCAGWGDFFAEGTKYKVTEVKDDELIVDMEDKLGYKTYTIYDNWEDFDLIKMGKKVLLLKVYQSAECAANGYGFFVATFDEAKKECIAENDNADFADCVFEPLALIPVMMTMKEKEEHNRNFTGY